MPAFAQKFVENLSTAEKPAHQLFCLWLPWVWQLKRSLTNLISWATVFHHIIRERSLKTGILAYAGRLIKTAASGRECCLSWSLLCILSGVCLDTELLGASCFYLPHTGVELEDPGEIEQQRKV